MTATAKRIPLSIDQIVAKATRAERTVSICVAGAIQAEYENLQHELGEVIASNQGTLGEPQGAGTTRLLNKIKALEKEMDEATFEFRFRALSARSWQDLLTKHPSADGTKMFDLGTFPNAAIAASCIEPEGLDEPGKVEALMEQLSAAQQDDLFNTVWEVNTSAPKGKRFSVGSVGA